MIAMGDYGSLKIIDNVGMKSYVAKRRGVKEVKAEDGKKDVNYI
jgi:hypothetical protein